MNKKVILMILDGWGKSPDPKVSAIDNANIPFIKSLYKNYPSAQLRTDGLNVGLPEGQMGNSEVGHMNLGAGRIVYQDLAKINLAVANKTLAKEQVLQDAFQYALDNHKKVHFLGLVSDGGVHSHTSHLRALIDASQHYGLKDVYIHAFTDGRDVDPKSGKKYIQDLENYIKNTSVELASIIGRYYAMDRDKRWERIKLAYDLLVNGQGTHSRNAVATIEESYANDVSDEFIDPITMTNSHDEPTATIEEGDVVIFFNFRTDRGRELTEVLTQMDLHEQNMHKLNLYYVTLTNYDETYKNVKVVYNKDNITETLGEVLEKANKTQIRIAETEKYPHVTFFFSGGREEPFIGESRILKNSPKVATYDLQPEMSAFELTDALIPELEKGAVDFICLNFANGDMVGHTGIMSAAIQACEAVEKCVEKVITAALANDYTTIVIADHGNCETMINPDGSPNTAHTTHPVPIILVDKELKQINDGVL
jgi:2,3-bisphosphoglycerate-independent phosphoglycerate mutase